MSDEHLAIASIPVQQWGEIFDDEEALCHGTIFKDLYKPFFAAGTLWDDNGGKRPKPDNNKKTDEQKSREQLMTKINQISFVLDDLTLYLDTHSDDEQAMELFRRKLIEKTELAEQFAAEFYPTTRHCILYCDCEQFDTFSWQKGPAPWEGANV